MATFKQYTKKDGSKLWMFKTYLGIDPSTGKEVKTTRRNFKTKKEAALAESRLRLEYQENGLSKGSAMTFQEVYELWFDSYSKTVKEATALNVAQYFRVHILPILGELKINKISVSVAQKAVNKWSEELKVYRAVLQYASKAINFAINLELIDKNPFDRVIRPNAQKEQQEQKLKFYTPEQVAQVLKYLEQQTGQQDRIKDFIAYWELTFFRLLAFTGLRSSEALALDWYTDIDFTKKKVTINKTLSRTKEGYKISTPKTKSSNRIVDLDDKTIHLLKRWQLKQKEFLFSNRVKDCPIVFSDMDGNYTTRQAAYFRALTIADKNDLPRIGVHGWRHTHASMLYASGVDMKKAQERLGHSSIEMTMNIYTHLSEKDKAKTVEKLSKFANF